MVQIRYAVVLVPEPDGSAVNVIVPAFPEAHTWGENVEDALRNAREVIELCLEQRSATGEEIPAGDSSQELASSVSVALPAA